MWEINAVEDPPTLKEDGWLELIEEVVDLVFCSTWLQLLLRESVEVCGQNLIYLLSQVVPNGLAAQNGRLRSGDMIKKVSDTSVTVTRPC